MEMNETFVTVKIKSALTVDEVGFAHLAASSGEEDGLVAAGHRALVFDVPALTAGHDAPLFLHL
jgi:hypothetical protein